MKELFAQLGIPFQEKYKESQVRKGLFGKKDITVQAAMLNILATFDNVLISGSVVDTLFWLTPYNYQDVREGFLTITPTNAAELKEAVLEGVRDDQPSGVIDIGQGDLENDFVQLGFKEKDNVAKYWGLGYCLLSERIYILDRTDKNPENPSVYAWYSDDETATFSNLGDLKSFLGTCFTSFHWSV